MKSLRIQFQKVKGWQKKKNSEAVGLSLDGFAKKCFSDLRLFDARKSSKHVLQMVVKQGDLPCKKSPSSTNPSLLKSY